MHPSQTMSQDNGSARRVVLVTGGSRGIGRTISLAFAAKGDWVCVSYLSNREAAEATLAELEAISSGHSLAAADVADPEACRRMVDEVKISI